MKTCPLKSLKSMLVKLCIPCAAMRCVYVSVGLDLSFSSPAVKLQVPELNISSLVFKLWGFDT